MKKIINSILSNLRKYRALGENLENKNDTNKLIPKIEVIKTTKSTFNNIDELLDYSLENKLTQPQIETLIENFTKQNEVKDKYIGKKLLELEKSLLELKRINEIKIPDMTKEVREILSKYK